MILPIKAKDNKDKEYDVEVYYLNDSKFYPNAPLLRIINTPGNWYLFTLLKDYHLKTLHGICIDGYNHWDCINFGEVLNCALQHVLKGELENES